MRGWIPSETDREGDNYFATREERKTSGSCASVVPNGSRFKVQVSLRPIAEIALNLAQNLQMRQDRRGRKRQETERSKTWRRKKGKLVVTRKDEIYRSSVHLITIRYSWFCIPDNPYRTILARKLLPRYAFARTIPRAARIVVFNKERKIIFDLKVFQPFI